MKSNLKKILLLLAFVFAIFSSLSFGDNNNPTLDTKSPEFVVKAFYSDYLSAWNDPDVGSGAEKSQNAIDSYTTQHLQQLNSDNDTGADYFINAQEICPDWVNEIEIKTFSVSNNNVAVELTLGHADSESKYDIGLVLKNDKWLINSVKFISRKTGHCNEN
ncbi:MULTISPECIES: DUF3828 domain-containing protein [Enterobacteriaceae]|uniref:DUF3828 domain-containing protein n=1 Tax=Enterobacteriaceae TaxID=543 RepID=UPI0011D1B104|nr:MULTISPECIES: DUF3828 domain-containing protein [Enterobacteriaceae]